MKSFGSQLSPAKMLPFGPDDKAWIFHGENAKKNEKKIKTSAAEPAVTYPNRNQILNHTVLRKGVDKRSTDYAARIERTYAFTEKETDNYEKSETNCSLPELRTIFVYLDRWYRGEGGISYIDSDQKYPSFPNLNKDLPPIPRHLASTIW